MTRQLKIQIDISAPTTRVWAVMIDVERWREWTASIENITLLDHAPLSVGSKVRIRQPRFPPVVWRVTRLEPGRLFAWESRSPGVTVTGTHSVVAVGVGSRATLQLDYAGPFGSILASLTRKISERYVALEAAGLKQRSEGPPV